MNTTAPVSRREFLQQAGLLGAGLVIAIHLPASARDGFAELAHASDAPFAPNAWLRIGTDDSVVVMVGQSEMGQGVSTSLPMLVAEELDADWSKVSAEFAPADSAYDNPIFRSRGTGGSTSMRGLFTPLRQAGAAARVMLVSAAAATWKVDAGSCHTEKGAVIHAKSGRRLTYGQLVEQASTLAVPTDVPLKDPKDWKIIGKPTRRLDNAVKTDGRAEFGIDVKVPGMLTAVVARCPTTGGKVARFDATQAKAVPGVKQVVQISSGVAVVADGFWPAQRGRAALDITWDEGPNAQLSSAGLSQLMAQVAAKPGAVARNDGDAEAALAAAATKLEASFELPYLAHATMEPMNCTAHVRADGVEIWAPTQGQTTAQNTGAEIGGVPKDKVQVHTTYLGGGFGRRSEADFVRDACETSKAVGAPVKVIYTREDDTRNDFYRPISAHRLRAALDASGSPTAWTHRVVSPSRALQRGGTLRDGVDRGSVEGAAEMPYAIPAVHVDYGVLEGGLPVGYWRAVNYTFNTFVIETFIDELAHAAKKDPYQYRRGLLAGKPRHRRVLDLAAEKAGWGKPLPAGRFRGIAVGEAMGSFVAEVAEVSVSPRGMVRVHKVVCAFDCGPVVNPLTVEAQAQSAIVYGLTAALWGDITIDKGRVKQGNFDDYRMLLMREMPVVETHIVASTDSLGGVGEPATPPIAPAVCNAIFAATGKRIRTLPIGTVA